MNKKMLLLGLVVAGLGLVYIIYSNYDGNCCKTTVETKIETPAGTTTEEKSEIENKTDMEGKPVEKKTSLSKKTVKSPSKKK